VLDIDPELLEYTEPPKEGLIRDARDYIAANEAHLPEERAKGSFSVGQRVRHEIMGEGTVVEVDPDKGAYAVQFDAMKTPRRISFRAKLDAVE
jgi:DNA helicase-2/ATP-dependent DNA helicase PcrA